MTRFGSSRLRRSVALVVLVLTASILTVGGSATAAPTPVGLGTATTFAIRAGDAITSAVAGTQITGDVGLPAPFAGITGLTCANIPSGTIFATDGAAAGPAPCSASDPGTTVAADAQASFNNTSALPGATPLPADLVGQNLVAGLYSVPAAATNLTGVLTLNAAGDPNAVWIFQASSTLITSSATVVTIINAPVGSNLTCNVFWTVGSSATLGASSTFVGTILASADITVNGPASGTATVVNGRLLAANQGSGAGQVTIPGLATIVRPAGCTTLPAGTGGTPTPPTTTPVITPVVGTPGRLTG